jgi:hypothetical protein
VDEKRFWDILSVGCPRDADTGEWFDRLVRELKKLPPDEILAFERLFDAKTAVAYTNDLWGVAYLINGGASDDGFYYFRCWLVGMGNQVYEAALADPDSLADVVSPEFEYEAGISAAGYRAWEELGLDAKAREDALTAAGSGPDGDLQGDDWDFDDDAEVRRRLPRLAAIYLDGEYDE